MPKTGPCRADGCERIGQIRRGWCYSHHLEWQRHVRDCSDPATCGQFHLADPPAAAGPRCAVDGCRRGGKLRRGWCSTHYWRWTRHGDPLHSAGSEDCAVADCDEPPRSRGYCARHYSRARYTGGDPLPHEHERRPKVDDKGYRRVWAPDAPCAMADGWAFEHRLVMERSLDRPLDPDETVHHRNGDRLDNRLANLELWCSRHPSGQRVEEITEWAIEMLARYRPEVLK